MICQQSGGQLTNPMNRYEAVDAATLSYDAHGNTLDDGINSYAYDVLNRQTVVTNTAAITTKYIYDARGRRVAKVSAGITITHYLYDIQYRVLEERDGSGQLLALYTYGAGIDEPLTMERGGQTYYYHRDALGSVTELSDASGAIVERYEYDVYGAVAIYDTNWITRTASDAGNPYLFTGRQFDPESGNYYYRARLYSPALGRFLSMDPLGFEAGDYNLYRYVRNNPLIFRDPSGHKEEGECGFWGEGCGPSDVCRETIKCDFPLGPAGRYDPMESAIQARDLMLDWFLERGEPVRFFGPSNSLTHDIMFDPGMIEFRKAWAQENFRLPFSWRHTADKREAGPSSEGLSDAMEVFIREQIIEFGLAELGLGSPTAQGAVDAVGGSIGSLDLIMVFDAGGDCVRFEVYNSMDWKSGLRVPATDVGPPRLPRKSPGPGGQMVMLFYWWEKKPCPG